MKIKKITLNNYKVYMGENIFEIPAEKKIVIIKGNNGSGKTTLIYSVIWCFYEVEREEKLSDIFNKDILFNLKLGEEIETYVEIQFIYEGSLYIVKRKIKYKKEMDDIIDDINNKTREEFLLEIISKNNEKKSEDDKFKIRNIINGIINQSLYNYFFFDATRIKEFMDESHDKNVKIAIKNLLNIETIVRAKKHLESLSKEFAKDIKKSENVSRDEKETIDKKEESEEILRNIKDEIEKLEEKKSDFTNQKVIHEKEMIKIQEYNDLIKRIKEEELKKDNFKNEEEEIKKGINNIMKQSYIFYSTKLISTAKFIYQDEDKKIDSNEYLKILKSSHDKKMCLVCEKKFTESEEKKAFERIIEMTKSSVEDNRKNKNYIKNSFELENELEKYKKDLPDLLIKEVNKKEEIEKIEEQLEILDKEKKKLAEINIGEDYQKVIDIIENCLRENENELINKKAERIHQEEKIKKIDLELERISKNFSKNEIKLKKYKILEDIKNEIENIYENYEKTKIKEINKNLYIIFKKIVEKEAFTNVFIDPDYKLNINLNERDENVLKNISDGEKVILSLSLIMALVLTANSSKLFMMDTPFEKLDKFRRERVVEKIPEFLDQLFLIVTDSQIDGEMLEKCENNLDIIFSLKQDSSKSRTFIEKEL